MGAEIKSTRLRVQTTKHGIKTTKFRIQTTKHGIKTTNLRIQTTKQGDKTTKVGDLVYMLGNKTAKWGNSIPWDDEMLNLQRLVHYLGDYVGRFVGWRFYHNDILLEKQNIVMGEFPKLLQWYL